MSILLPHLSAVITITSIIWIVDSQQMPHSFSPPQGMCVIASGYSIFLSGMTLERLQKDSLWEKSLEQVLANVSDMMHIIIPYSISAIKNFVGHFFPIIPIICYFQISFCSFLKSMLMIIWQVKQIFQNLKLALYNWSHELISQLSCIPKDRRLRTLFTLIFLQQSLYFSVQNLLHLLGK